MDERLVELDKASKNSEIELLHKQLNDQNLTIERLKKVLVTYTFLYKDMANNAASLYEITRDLPRDLDAKWFEIMKVAEETQPELEDLLKGLDYGEF